MNSFKIFTAQNIYLLVVFLIPFMILAIQVESFLFGTLNFDRENNALIDIENKIKRGAPTTDHELAIACPAQLSHEADFNLKHSFGKNSLFVRSVYEAMADPQFVENRICKDIYKLSISFHRSVQELEFGYEIYYDKKKYSHFKDSNYDEYDQVSMAYSKTRRITALAGNLFISKNKLEWKTNSGDPLTLGFVWILIFRLKFDNSIKRPIQAIYTLSKGTEVGAECADYSLGDEVYNKQGKADYMDSLYRNQANIFKNIFLPTADYLCPEKNNCLTKYSLVPAEEFRFRSPEPTRILCSNLTTVPIWRSTVEEAIKKVDTFLYALAKFAYKTINVVSGVHGQLAIGSIENKKISVGGIPVPNIIYKSISYEFGVQEKDEFAKEVYTFTWKAIVIVIHNEPDFKESNALCSKRNCEKWGWKEILNDSRRPTGWPAPNNIFCCPKNEEIAAKIGMKKNSQATTDVLNLREFPMYDKQQGKIVTENIEERVIYKMIKMFEDEKNAEDDHANADADLELLDEDSNSGESSDLQQYKT